MKEDFNAKETHLKASLLMQEAFMCTVHGKDDEAIILSEQAFELEREAALSLLNKEDLEPTRSILFRSAAALAKDCHRYEDSEKMIAYALSGNPPEYVKEQLREIYDSIRKFLPPKKTQKPPKERALVSA